MSVFTCLHLKEDKFKREAVEIVIVSCLLFFFKRNTKSQHCGQAFEAGQVNMLGVYMQRSWVILSLTSILLLPIYIFAAPILKLLGQQEDIADLAGSFSILVIPQFLSLPFNFPTQKFLQAQSKVNVIGWTGLVALILHIGILWFLIYVLDFGLDGATLAFDITSWGSQWLNLFML